MPIRDIGSPLPKVAKKLIPTTSSARTINPCGRGYRVVSICLARWAITAAISTQGKKAALESIVFTE